MTTLETFDGAPLAVVLLGASGTIERATDAFMDRYGSDDTLATHHGQIEQVIAGGLDHANVKLDGASAELFAVVSQDGQRHALLTIPLETNGHPGGHSPVALLEGTIEASRAIVWLKDLDGRYLRVNRRYTEELQTDSEEICGRTDADLPTTKSIEGWRLRADDLVPQEPLELEYTVPAFDDRPAYSVLRFALRDADGQPLAVCGIAAPLSQAQVARSECERLMRVERWSRLDERAIRKELLDDWGLAPAGAHRPSPGAPGASDAGAPPGADAFRIAAERDAAIAASESLNQQLAEERTQLQALQSASSEATQRAEDLLGTLTAEQSRTSELEQLLVLAQARLEELGSEHASARSSAEQSEAIAQALASERETVEALRSELAEAQEQLERMREAQQAQPSAEQIEAERARAEQAALEAEQAQARATASAEALESERRTVEELRADLDAARAETEEAQRAAAEVASQAPKVEELDGERARAAQAEASLAQERERTEQAETQAEQERARAEQAEASLAHERARAEHTEAALQQERAEGEQRWTGTESELAETRAELIRVRDESGASAAALAAERQTAENLRAELARVREDLESAQRAIAEAPTSDELDEQRTRAERAEAALEQAQSATEQNANALAAEQETTQLLRVELRAARQEVRRARETAGAAATADEATRQERARAEQAETALEQERARAEQAEAALEQQRARAEAAEAALVEEQRQAEEQGHAEELRTASETAATEQLKDELAQALARAERAQSEASTAAVALEQREQALQSLREELSARTEIHEPTPRSEERVAAGRVWGASSQRALSAALIGAGEWRTALKQVVKALGEEGGWDAAVAWCPDQWRGWMRCVGVWTGQAPEVTAFETMTWQHRPEMTGTEFGRARNRPGPTNLLELQTAEDNLLRAAAAEGMTSALLVPIQNAVMTGPDMLAMIGLLGHSEVPADPDLILSLEAIALQLSTIGHLLETAASPHWGLGRL